MSVEENNARIEEELRARKKTTSTDKSGSAMEIARNISGNFMAIVGRACSMCGAIGAGMLVITGVMSLFNLGLIASVILLAVVGVVLSYLGDLTYVKPWLKYA